MSLDMLAVRKRLAEVPGSAVVTDAHSRPKTIVKKRLKEVLGSVLA